MFGVTDPTFQQMMETGNDPLAVAAAIKGSLRPTRYVDPATIDCPATYYVGSKDWIVPHVRADVDALGATLDVIDGQGHLGSFFGAAPQVLAAVGARS
jgi:pimeloyl-ACP methyl ester carboxylesterase